MYEDRTTRGASLVHQSAFTIPSTQRYEEVVHAGPAAHPLDFPTPVIGSADHLENAVVFDHNTGRRLKAKNVLVSQGQPRGDYSTFDDPAPITDRRAYLTKKKLVKTSYGQLRLCVVLRPFEARSRRRNCSEGAWRTTDELVVVKSSFLDAAFCHGSLTELRKDPLCEVAAQQYLGNYHPHLLSCHEAFQDEEYVFTVFPYCHGGDLYKTLIDESSNTEVESGSVCSASSQSLSSVGSPSVASPRPVEESRAREWFCQLLEAVSHLQKKGVCHGGLCLENILTDNEGNLILSDFALSMRIPYSQGLREFIGGTGITDVSEGSSRRLIRSYITNNNVRGKGHPNPLYMAPELFPSRQQAGDHGFECYFDGFAVDLWSLGIALFIILTGTAPFRKAHQSDARFVQVSVRGLLHKLASTQGLSSSAVNLLQNMLWANPSDRLSLEEILAHPWVNSPNNRQRCGSSELKPECADLRPTKPRIHHLSFVDCCYHSCGGAEALSEETFGFVGQVLERGKVLRAEERMASF